eukprot:c34449_g1_i1 orf=102-305(+)
MTKVCTKMSGIMAAQLYDQCNSKNHLIIISEVGFATFFSPFIILHVALASTSNDHHVVVFTRLQEYR